MSRMKVDLKAFRAAMGLALAASRHHPVAPERAVQLRANGARLFVRAGGGAVALLQALEIKEASPLPSADVAVPARALQAAVAGLKGEHVTLTLDAGVRLEVDGYTASVDALEEAPAALAPDVFRPVHTLHLPARAFYESLRYVARAIPRAGTHVRLGKVLLEPGSGNHLRLTATDGYWLTTAEITGVVGEPLEDALQLFLPGEALALLQFLGHAGPEDCVKLGFDREGTRLRFDDGARVLQLPAAEAGFPEYDGLFTRKGGSSVLVEADSLVDAVRRMRGLVGKGHPVHLYYLADVQRLLVRARGDVGAAEANLEVQGAGPSFRLAFLPEYLEGALSGLRQAKLVAGHDQEPMIVAGTNVKAAIMPLRSAEEGIWSDLDGSQAA